MQRPLIASAIGPTLSHRTCPTYETSARLNVSNVSFVALAMRVNLFISVVFCECLSMV